MRIAGADRAEALPHRVPGVARRGGRGGDRLPTPDLPDMQPLAVARITKREAADYGVAPVRPGADPAAVAFLRAIPCVTEEAVVPDTRIAVVIGCEAVEDAGVGIAALDEDTRADIAHRRAVGEDATVGVTLHRPAIGGVDAEPVARKIGRRAARHRHMAADGEPVLLKRDAGTDIGACVVANAPQVDMLDIAPAGGAGEAAGAGLAAGIDPLEAQAVLARREAEGGACRRTRSPDAAEIIARLIQVDCLREIIVLAGEDHRWRLLETGVAAGLGRD